MSEKKEYVLCERVKVYHSDPNKFPVTWSEAYKPVEDGIKRVTFTREEFDQFSTWCAINGTRESLDRLFSEKNS